MDISELTNTPIDISFKKTDGTNKNLKCARLTIKDILGFYESVIKSRYIKNVQALAEVLSGDEKISFIKSCMKDMPSGDKMLGEIQAEMQTISGIKELIMLGIKKYNPNANDEIIDDILSVEDNADSVKIYIEYLTGISIDDAVTTDDVDKKK